MTGALQYLKLLLRIFPVSIPISADAIFFALVWFSAHASSQVQFQAAIAPHKR